MKTTKRISCLIISGALTISMLSAGTLSANAAASLWDTTQIQLSVPLENKLSKEQKELLTSYQNEDSAVGKAVSASTRKKVKKTLKCQSLDCK